MTKSNCKKSVMMSC